MSRWKIVLFKNYCPDTHTHLNDCSTCTSKVVSNDVQGLTFDKTAWMLCLIWDFGDASLVDACWQTVTTEQRQRMERSRQLALERRAARLSMSWSVLVDSGF